MPNNHLESITKSVDISSSIPASMRAPSSVPLDVPIETGLLARVVRHIERNIESQELSPRSICHQVGISRSQLYRLFASSGGVASYIRLCRLIKARAELTSASRQRISNVAYKYGFTSHAHFSRVFKQHFGYTPWECIASSRA